MVATAKPIIISFFILSKGYNFMMGDLRTNPYKIAEVFNKIHIPKRVSNVLVSKKYKRTNTFGQWSTPPPLYCQN